MKWERIKILEDLSNRNRNRPSPNLKPKKSSHSTWALVSMTMRRRSKSTESMVIRKLERPLKKVQLSLLRSLKFIMAVIPLVFRVTISLARRRKRPLPKKVANKRYLRKSLMKRRISLKKL